MNFALLVFHILLVSALTLYFLRLGKEAMMAWLALLAVTANLFVHKQITLFGLSVTCSDALAVGYLLGSNLIQEFFGREPAKKSIWIAFSLSIAFVLLASVHLNYIPNHFDQTQEHFSILLKPMPRMIGASLFSFLIVQLIDISFFAYLRNKMGGKYLTFRVMMCATCAHGLDTLLFSILGLYGVIASITDVMLFSFSIKCLVTLVASPFVMLSRKIVHSSTKATYDI